MGFSTLILAIGAGVFTRLKVGEVSAAIDEGAFERLVEPHRPKLHALCYRMLGSYQDAEDAVQETLVRAWRARERFEGRSALSTWLHRIATNVCLTAIERRGSRALPIEIGAPTDDPSAAAAEPLAESVWIEPYPDAAQEYEQRETLELAFVAALQHLPPNQRAALILSEVLGYSASEVAATMETTTASVNSALQPARRLLDERLPDRSQQATVRVLGDERVNRVVTRYVEAMERADVGAVVELLSEDATWSMPPQPAWFRGHGAIGAFLAENPFRYFTWRLVPVAANGQPALACYSRASEDEPFLAHSINVLSLHGGEISEVVSFLNVSRRGVDAPSFVETGVFERFGLSGELR